MKIYVASSWRNEFQQNVVQTLRNAGHKVYDFKNPDKDDHGFHWSEIDPDWENWTPEKYVQGLYHPIAEAGFKKDFDAMKWADVCVLVLPCGRSAHTEAGWMQGVNKPVLVLLEEQIEPELMYKVYHACCTNHDDMFEELRIIENKMTDFPYRSIEEFEELIGNLTGIELPHLNAAIRKISEKAGI